MSADNHVYFQLVAVTIWSFFSLS